MKQSEVLVAVPGGVKHVGLRTRALYELSNWLVLIDCFPTFNTVTRPAMLEEMVNCVPALTPHAAKC